MAGRSRAGNNDIESSPMDLNTIDSQLQFINNQVSLKKENPQKIRDGLLLWSWSGILLAICSVASVVNASYKLLPIFYQSNCHVPRTLAISSYPGASLAILDAWISLAFFVLLKIGTVLVFVLTFLPDCMLKKLPRCLRHSRRRMRENRCVRRLCFCFLKRDKETGELPKVWQPENF